VNKLETLVPPGVFGNPLLAFVRGSLEATTFSAIFQFKEATPASQVRKTAVMFVTALRLLRGMGLKSLNFLSQFFTDILTLNPVAV